MDPCTSECGCGVGMDGTFLCLSALLCNTFPTHFQPISPPSLSHLQHNPSYRSLLIFLVFIFFSHLMSHLPCSVTPTLPFPSTRHILTITSRPYDSTTNPHLHTSASRHLQDLRLRQLRLKHPIPKSARDSESILIVCKMVLQVVFLEFAVIRR